MRTGRSRLFVCVLLIAAVIAGAVSVVKENISEEADCAAQLSSHIIRFHVRANSDSDRDQQLKINVKEKVVQYIEPLLKDSCSIDESREILKENIPEIKEVALKQLEADGSDDSVNDAAPGAACSSDRNAGTLQSSRSRGKAARARIPGG